MRLVLLILGAFLAFVGLTALAVYLVLPTLYFNRLGSEGIHNRWVQFDPLPRSLLYVPTFSTAITPDASWAGTAHLWKKFRFRDFNFLFPMQHPNYRLTPAIEERDGAYAPGLAFMDEYSHQLLFKIWPTTFTKVYWPQESQALFKLPFVRRWLAQSTPAQWWHDLWTLDLRPKKWQNFGREGQHLLRWKEAIYALFIAQCRQEFFGEVKHLSFDPAKNLGLAALDKSDNLYIYERLYAFAEDNFYLLDWQMRLGNLSAESFREHLFQEIEFAPRRPDDVYTLYHEFTALPYAKKKADEGLMYLYLAWSYDLQNDTYLRTLIHYLEKGKDNFSYLAPLYTYIHQVYGDKFVSMRDLQKAEAYTQEQARLQAAEAARAAEEAENNERLPASERLKNVIQKAKHQWQQTQKIRRWQKD